MAAAARCVLNKCLMINSRNIITKIPINISIQRQLHTVLKYQFYETRIVPVQFTNKLNNLHRATFIRTLTSESSNESSNFVLEAIPEPPIPAPQLLDEGIVEAIQTVVGEPSFSSLGLANYTPVGFIQGSLEWIHLTFDLPWWGAIIAGTIVLRICMFPLVILGQRNAARMHNNTPQMQILQEKIGEARRYGDHFEALRYSHELLNFMNEKGVNPLKNMVVPLAQAPIFISCFIGLRKMANLPVMSLKTGGLAWFTDLTVTDPFYILPLLTSATLFITLEIGAEGGMRIGNMKMMRYVFRALPIIAFPFVINFPTVLVWYWTVNNVITLGQVALLRIPRVREYFKIEKLMTLEVMPMSKKPFMESFRETMANAKIAKEIQDRRNVDEMAFKKAGLGPMRKTYSYDPTKQKDRTPTTAVEAKASKKS